MKKKRIAILGVTGSIGQSALDVVRRHPDRFEIVSMAAGTDDVRMRAAVDAFSPSCAALADETAAARLAEACKGKGRGGTRILSGAAGVIEAVADSGADICLSAAVGEAGLAPTLAAIEAGIDIALANKEVLVAAGSLVMARARQRGVRILPVDSEHSALLQCMTAGRIEEVERVVLTASGGPFRGFPPERLAGVTVDEALTHPTWQMGAKVTLDSATLANKALEVIEAHWLFGIGFDRIEVYIHPQSMIHGMVAFRDGSLMAHVAHPDMRIPILHALAHPERLPSGVAAPGLRDLAGLTFEAPDTDAFPMLAYGYEAGRAGGLCPAVYSAANEEAGRLFQAGRIPFCAIPEAVRGAMDALGLGGDGTGGTSRTSGASGAGDACLSEGTSYTSGSSGTGGAFGTGGIVTLQSIQRATRAACAWVQERYGS